MPIASAAGPRADGSPLGFSLAPHDLSREADSPLSFDRIRSRAVYRVTKDPLLGDSVQLRVDRRNVKEVVYREHRGLEPYAGDAASLSS
jgi:hypothetical protein